MPNGPHYSLEEIKNLLRDPDTRIIRRRDRAVAASLGYADDDEMVDRIIRLHPSEFYKTMEAETPGAQGLWQDVYKSNEGNGTGLYIKLQIASGAGVVISFKQDTSRR
ncbi:type II toxin-antitoxin system MqsR family toxin [Geomonas subterranea]|uniref:Type II toxin-antitoxin system MqsR family toxin n=2 Tax=Geomonas subterranea TaxID=2847989 RepID=A0ABX8LIA2_9BACT|nr:type II toxin-antitoxin system MqsR family toxin [Geomonas subterranea]QXE89963.1 type II toxin-antitoxin system MqsR family toxin [Geomonas subterranea]QXM07918.1 type II toxin-antitoxin system MqsR family toxin [Geomonas subterranea]